MNGSRITSILHAQAEIFNMEKLVEENRRFNYYLPVIDKKTNEIIGNIVVTVDYKKYFTEIFHSIQSGDISVAMGYKRLRRN